LKRRRLILAGLITLILLFGWYFFFRLPFLTVHPFEAVSNSTAMVFSVSDGQSFLQPASVLDSLLGTVLNETQYALNLKLIRQVLAKEGQRTAPMLLSLQNPGTANLSILAIVDLRGKNFDFEAFIKQLPAERMQTLYYRNRTFYRVFLKDKQELTFANYRNLLLVSRYPLLVEDAISRLAKPSGNLMWNAGFRPLLYQQKTPVSIFVRLENMPLLLSNWLQANGKTQVEDWKNKVEWLRMDPKAGDKTVFFSGGLVTADDKNIWKALSGQRAARMGAMMRVIPDNVAMVQWMNVSNARKLLRSVSTTQSDNLNKYIAPWVGEEVGLVRTQDERFVVLRIENTEEANTSLDALAKKVGQLKSYQYGTFEMKQIMDETLFQPLFGTEGLLNPHFTIIENYAVFASSRSALEVWIDEYMVNKTMGRNVDFLKLYQKWKDRPINAFVYLNMANFAPRVRAALRTEGLLNDKQLEQFGQIGMILNEKSSKWRMEGYWTRMATTAPIQTNTAWKTLLDYEAITPPMLVGKGTKDEPYLIAIQDSAFQLYLLDEAGNEITKKKLDGKILSAVQPVSYYRSSEQQFLFNTAKNIYLLDRKGEAQGTFPIRLQTPATNGVTAIDFDSNQQYSFFVACANGGVYGFDHLGRPLQGWNPLRGVGEVRHPILHFQQDGKDFLIVLNESGKLFAFKRDGSNRFATVNFGVQCPSPPEVQLFEKSNRIVATDKNGRAHVVGLDGSTFGLALFPKAEQDVRFAFADVAGDARKDYVGLVDTSLVVHFYEGTQFKPLYRTGFDTPQRDVLPVRVSGREKALVGTVSAKKQQIFLLQEDGKIYPDFPLAGTTRFFIADLFGNGQQILVVANGDSVYAYRVKL